MPLKSTATVLLFFFQVRQTSLDSGLSIRLLWDSDSRSLRAPLVQLRRATRHHVKFYRSLLSEAISCIKKLPAEETGDIKDFLFQYHEFWFFSIFSK